jgi:hypothetical protein
MPNKLYYGDNLDVLRKFVRTWTWDDHANIRFDEILTNKNGVQTHQSIALINGLEKVFGKGALFILLPNTIR